MLGNYTFKIIGTAGELSTSEHFTITLIDPCGEGSMNNILPSQLENQFYTIGEPSLTYNMPPFSSSLAYCPITYTCEVSPSISDLITLQASTTPSITISYSEDLSLSGLA